MRWHSLLSYIRFANVLFQHPDSKLQCEDMSFVEQDAIMKKLEVSQGGTNVLLIQHTGTTRCVIYT